MLFNQTIVLCRWTVVRKLPDRLLHNPDNTDNVAYTLSFTVAIVDCGMSGTVTGAVYTSLCCTGSSLAKVPGLRKASPSWRRAHIAHLWGRWGVEVKQPQYRQEKNSWPIRRRTEVHCKEWWQRQGWHNLSTTTDHLQGNVKDGIGYEINDCWDEVNIETIIWRWKSTITRRTDNTNLLISIDKLEHNIFLVMMQSTWKKSLWERKTHVRKMTSNQVQTQTTMGCCLCL